HRYVLEPGMTFALELKMVFPEHGAVGFENTILVTETGWEKLTAADERFICV
ncbi:MAG: M24 family metallopeptidase, partial [Deltaproteobacteria bacterium]|nr:M24 family metallopeptidase [Deltaproteobacteria bacterium]